MDNSDFLVGFLAVIAIFILFFVILIGVIFNVRTPNNGSHTGYVTAVEKTGLIFRTNTVYFKTDTQSSQEDTYCATDEVIETLKQAQIEKKLITINYNRSFILPIWECPRKAETQIVSVK